LSFFQNVLLNNGVISGKESKTEFSFTCESSNCAVSIGQFLLQPNEKLKTGDLIKLDKTKNEPVDLFDKKTGKVIAKGDVCLIDEKFTIHITEVL
jgi:flagellar motor switch/type III secretory pathway protein FliN